MSRPFQNIIVGAVFFVGVFCIATAGYVVAGWTFFDAFYMTVITIFGVGYGEVRPIEHSGLRLFTIGVIVMGYAAAIYTVGGFVQLVAEGEITKALGARRMTKGIERLSDHAIVCGYGRMGRILAQELADAGMPFVVVDSSAEKIQEAETRGFLVLHGDAHSEEVLRTAGIMRARVLATVLPEDAANVFITLTASDLNPKLEIIARGENPATEKKLLRSGAASVVLPAAIGAHRAAQLITCPSAQTLLANAATRDSLNHTLNQIGMRLDELRVSANSKLRGRPMSEMAIRSNQGFLVVALLHRDGSTVINPDSEQVLQEGDVIIVLGHVDDTAELADRYALQKSVRFRGASVESA